jgi:hypothetical protein
VFCHKKKINQGVSKATRYQQEYIYNRSIENGDVTERIKNTCYKSFMFLQEAYLQEEDRKAATKKMKKTVLTKL